MRHILCLTAVGLLTAFATASPAAPAGTGLNPPPTLETLNGSSLVPPFNSSITCQDVANGTGTYTMSGASGAPYPGTFTETGTLGLTGGVVTSFSATFTITSGPTTLHGTKSGPVTFRGTAQCDAPSPDFGAGTNFFHAGPFDARYAVTITGPLGTNDFTGPVQNDFNFTSGIFLSGGMQEVLLAPDDLAPPPPCRADDDDDDGDHDRAADEDDDGGNNHCEEDEDD